VTATDEGCADAKPGKPCETAFNVFVLAHGRLADAAAFALDRVDYKPFGGLPGLAKVRLTATPVFQERTMRVVEQIVITDQNQGVVRKSDLERVFKLGPNGKLEPSAPTLWNEVAPGSEPASTPDSGSKAAPQRRPTSK
jgi:hypothetical protein